MKAYDSLSTLPDVELALKKLATNEGIQCLMFPAGTNSMVSNSVHNSKDLLGHPSLFKEIITIDDLKKFKPAPEVYEHLAKSVDKVGHEGDI